MPTHAPVYSSQYPGLPLPWLASGALSCLSTAKIKSNTHSSSSGWLMPQQATSDDTHACEQHLQSLQPASLLPRASEFLGTAEPCRHQYICSTITSTKLKKLRQHEQRSRDTRNITCRTLNVDVALAGPVVPRIRPSDPYSCPV